MVTCGIIIIFLHVPMHFVIYHAELNPLFLVLVQMNVTGVMQKTLKRYIIVSDISKKKSIVYTSACI